MKKEWSMEEEAGQLRAVFSIADENGRLVATGVLPEHAERICTCHNAHDDLVAAGKSQTEIIRRAQTILTHYLRPDGPSDSETLNELLGLLDGPDQRAAQDAWDAALAKVTPA